jgi:hypothetical protein
MNQTWRIICISITVILFSFKFIRFLNPPPEGNAQIIAKIFQPEWQNEGDTMEKWVKYSLKENRIPFKRFYIKKNINDSNEAVVACTSDDETFQFYKYNYKLNRVEAIKDNGISKPH